MESKKYLAASDRIDVIVNTVVMPRETRAGVASTAIQKDTQLYNISNYYFLKIIIPQDDD